MASVGGGPRVLSESAPPREQHSVCDCDVLDQESTASKFDFRSSDMSGAGKLTASFRKAGLNYLEYLNTQTTALRSVLKEPMRSEVMGRTSFSYRAFTYPAGVESKPLLVSNDSVKVEE